MFDVTFLIVIYMFEDCSVDVDYPICPYLSIYFIGSVYSFLSEYFFEEYSCLPLHSI